FQTENMPDTEYIVIPEVSSERREYIPIGFLTPDILCSNKLRLMPDGTKYHFGVLISLVHMAWMRVVCGRLKSDYDYSIKIVYNNFPWPEEAEAHRAAIKKTAQGILDARALYSESSLADLYDTAAMPQELRRAHRANDKAVLAAYGLAPDMAEADIVAALMARYQALAAL
ncbi:MAG: class I SAM-dependent DNA methyltransferase, partial [Deltaproteobacteria bacterium]|nr:class I SAM-dependent DNA methyltransferase [Deltaproteobacteria bacterium]